MKNNIEDEFNHRVPPLEDELVKLKTSVANLSEGNMIDTTNLEENLSNLDNNMNTNSQALVDAILYLGRTLGADFTQVEVSASDVKSGKKFFDDEGVLQTGTIPTFEGDTTITENGTVETGGKFVEDDLTIAVPRPQLNAPTLAISGDTLTITNPNTNGNFAVGFDIFADGALICTTANTSVDLSEFLDEPATYAITASCTAEYFEDSAPSASVSYTIAEPVQSTVLTSVAEITSLLNDYVNEENFNTSTEEKLQFGTLLGNTPCAKIWFRQKPTNLANEQIVLQFFITGLTNPTAIPAVIKLNNTTVFSGNLTLVSGQDYLATCTVNITSGFVPFNELTVEFTDTTQATAYLDYVNISISNTQNCIVLNRDTSFELYGLQRTNGNLVEYARQYYNRINYWIGGENKNFTTSLTLNDFDYITFDNDSVKYAMAYIHQLYNSTFSFIPNQVYEVYITQNNTLYAAYTEINRFNITTIRNVNYAKKSLHNGNLTNTEYICYSCFDFSVGLASFVDNQGYVSAIKTNIKLNNELINSEFIDIIPINDYLPGLRTKKMAIGYFLLHKSGNIIYIPDVNSTYAIKIAKGRQVHAFLQSDGNTIHIYYNVDNNVYMKTLTRANENANWELTSTTQTFNNAKEIYERGTNGTTMKIFNNILSFIT